MRVKTIFCSSEKSDVNHELDCYCNYNNEIAIFITDPEHRDDLSFSQFIAFDRETAIKFSKHLRREIAKIEREVNVG